MTKPRLFVLTECYPQPSAPGSCAFVHRQLTGVAAAGWDVQVLIPNGWFPPIAWRLAAPWREARQRALPRNWTLDGVRVSELRYQNRVPSRWSRPFGASDRIAVALRHYLAQGAVPGRDALLVQFALPYGSIASAVANQLRLSYAVFLRGDDVWIWPKRSETARRAFLDAVRGAGLVLAVAGALIEEAEDMIDGSLRAAVVPNGIDLQLFRPLADESERKRLREKLGLDAGDIAIVTVADPLVRKGWTELLDALALLKQEGLSVVCVAVVGPATADIDVPAEAAARASDVPLQIHRGIRGAGVAEILRAADVFALPSHWEGIANAVLEAMASGVVVVTTHVAGHPEAITSGIDGELVPPHDVESLRDALGRLCRNPSLRGRMGAAARSRAEAIGDSRKNGWRLADLLRDLVAGRPPVERVNPYQPSTDQAAAGR